ncbi:MAG: sensor domain-containing protein [Salinibacterium sp.]|nr:sensor domain-containing protein [Salinibacterium sp.]
MTSPTPVVRYARLWRATPRELAYILTAFPVAIAGFGITLGLFVGGISTLFTFFIGALLLIAALYVARFFGGIALSLLDWAGRPPITRPEWQDARARTGFLGWLRAVLGNGHYWLYLLHTMLLDFVMTVVSWTLTVVWLVTGMFGLIGWAWTTPGTRDSGEFFISQALASNLGRTVDNPALLDSILLFCLGVVLIATLPFVTRGFVMLHWFIARGVLAAFVSDALVREVATLSQSREAAVSAEGHSLRRLERDIHDGPQQRLVRLQMDLAAAERQLDTDPAKARTLIAEAMQQSKDALEELRALSRGFAPPILLDRGLVAALESSAVRNPVPARVTSALGESFELPQEIERNAYFIASEALVNATKHSGATAIEVHLSAPIEGEPPQRWLAIVVSDNGSGGAYAVPEHGIAGLEERLRGLGGRLELVSPAGGPTFARATIPIGTVKSRQTATGAAASP